MGECEYFADTGSGIIIVPELVIKIILVLGSILGGMLNS